MKEYIHECHFALYACGLGQTLKLLFLIGVLGL